MCVVLMFFEVRSVLFSFLLLVDQTAVSHALGAVDLNLLEWVCIGVHMCMYVHMYLRTCVLGRTVEVS